MFYTIYETTNLVNGKKYRGYHMTTDLNDGYLGSGTAIGKAIKKHGKENFKKEILEFCGSAEEMIEREKFYVTTEWVKDKNNYNLQPGGRIKPIDEVTKRKIRETLKRKYASGELISSRKGKAPWNKGIKYTEEQNAVFTKSKIGNKNAKSGGTTWNKGLKTGPLSEDHRKKISDTIKSMPSGKKGKRYPGSQLGKRASNKGVKAPILTCPRCGKDVGGHANFKRWHGDNCKKNFYN